MKLEYPTGTFEAFFEPLVGDEDKQHQFAAALAARINDYGNSFGQTHPYYRLTEGVRVQVKAAADAIDASQLGETPDKVRRSLTANPMLGSHLTLGALEAIDIIYQNRVRVPQQQANVEANVQSALRSVFGIAFGDGYSGVVNAASLYSGRSPYNPKLHFSVLYSALIGPRIIQRVPFNIKAYRSTTDRAGQLSIYPRRKPIHIGSEGRCPATHATAEVNGRPKSALWIFMSTIGSVAVSEIYPRHFEIVE